MNVAARKTGASVVKDTSVQPGQKFVLSPSVRVVRSPDGAALLDIKAGTCLALNPTGLFIWDRLGSGQVESEIVAALASECMTSPESVSLGYRRFIQKLLDYRLIGASQDAFAEPDQARRSWMKRLFGRTEK